MKKIIGVISLLWLSSFVLVTLLEQSLSIDLVNFIIDVMVNVLWVFMPFLIASSSFALLFCDREELTLWVQITVVLAMMSSITLFIYFNVATTDFGIVFLILWVFGSQILFVALLLLKLLYAYFFKQNLKDVLGAIFNLKVLKSLLLGGLLTFLLGQSFLIVSAIEAYKAVKILKPKGCQDYALAYFYRPYAGEIRLCNEMRWSYGRLKFVENGR